MGMVSKGEVDNLGVRGEWGTSVVRNSTAKLVQIYHCEYVPIGRWILRIRLERKAGVRYMNVYTHIRKQVGQKNQLAQ
jgi:hypothetical protein